jgi:hypothetical protein
MPELEVKLEVRSNDIEIQSLCQGLFNEWLFDLDYQEKEIWLWNSLVKLAEIKQRRIPVKTMN